MKKLKCGLIQMGLDGEMTLEPDQIRGLVQRWSQTHRLERKDD